MRVVLALGVLVLLAAATVADVRQAAYDALLAGLGRGGVMLLPLDDPLTEQWRAPTPEIVGDMGPYVLVAGTDGVRALDAQTGDTRWERPLAAGGTEVCRPRGDHAGRTFPEVGPQGAPAPERDVTEVLCLLTSATRDPGSDGAPTDAPARTTVTVLDGSSGEPVRSQTVEGLVVASHIHERDLVLVTVADDAGLRLTRWDPDEGRVRWRREVAPEEGAGLRFAGWQRGVLTVATRAGTLAYSLDSGRELRVTKPLPARVVAVERRLMPRGGLEVVWGYYAPAADGGEFPGGAGAVIHPDEREVPLPGPPLTIGVDDGSEASVLLVALTSTTVGALDVEDGAVRWESRHSTSTQVAARVDGVAVLLDGTTATALDVRTGRSLWTSDGVVDRPGSLGLTDGERVLLRHSQDGRQVLTAHDLRTGTARWTAPLPEGTEDVVGLAGGRVVAGGDGWIAGLGR